MIVDLVDAAQADGGQLTLECRPVDLRAFLTALLHGVSAVLDVPRIHVDLPADLPAVSADPERLKRIILNLLSNALKYPACSPRIPPRPSACKHRPLVVPCRRPLPSTVGPQDVS